MLYGEQAKAQATSTCQSRLVGYARAERCRAKIVEAEVPRPTVVISELAKQERRPLTQDQRRQLSERRLLDAATDLVAESGAAKLILAAIGERAGYSRGMVRERFGSKSGLMAALVRDIQERFVTAVLAPAIGAAKGLKAAEACVHATLRSLEGGDSLGPAFLTLVGESLALDPDLRSSLARVGANYRRRFAGYVEQAIGEGDVREDQSPEAAAFLIVGVLIGLAIQFLVDPEGMEIESMRVHALDLLHRALTTA